MINFTNADAETTHKNHNIDHFIISFHFFIPSSSQPEITILKEPKTIAHTANKDKNTAIFIVQLFIFTFNQSVISKFQFGGLTRDVQFRHQSIELLISQLKEQAQKVFSEKIKNTIINANTILLMILNIFFN